MTKEIKLEDLKADAKVCGNCRFFKELPKDMGLCKRFPPSIQIKFKHSMQNNNFIQHTGPVVGSMDWCGEFKLKTENQKKLGLA